MKSGYDIKWSNHALNELQGTFAYIQTHWTEKEVKNLAEQVERTILIISHNPKLFQLTELDGIRRAVVMRKNSIFFRVRNKSKEVVILSFFNNYRNPIE